MTSTEELKQFFQSYLDAYFNKRDLELLKPLLGDSLQGIGSGLHEIALNRRDSDELYRRDIEDIPNSIDYQLLQLDIRRPLPDIGLIFAVLSLDVRLHEQQMQVAPLRFSLVVVRENAAWKIHQLHVSLPSDLHEENESYPIKELEARQTALEKLVAEKTAQLEAALAEAQQLACTDQLTGLKNRFSIETLVLEKLAQVRQKPRPLSLIILDIDWFKSINDQHGHQTGDLVLRLFADQLRLATTAQITAGRWGGEEFLLLLEDMNLEEAHRQAEALRLQIAQADFSPLKQVTASFGVAQMQPKDSLDDLLLRADACLYQAKAQGRNRVVSQPQ